METLLEAIVIGIVQGLTEFLPISSSAHLIAVPRLLGWNDPFLNSAGFDVMLHLGTLAALLAVFWRDLWRLAGAWVLSLRERSLAGDPDRRLAWFVALSLVPAALVGASFEDLFDTYFRERLLLVAIFVLAGAGILWLAERRATQERDLGGMRFSDAVLVGLAQALALFPGISRSGITIAAGLLVGLEREAAARFSFLIGTPIIAGAGLWKLRLLASGGFGEFDPLVLLAGVAASAVAGLAAIRFLLAYLRRRDTGIFIGYRLVFAAVIVAFLLRG
ncbi:MAG TPA: undecaprenyl-diphosphatase UppP [Candidatus Limnocylindrales bacterium]|nr:undecaprenyl-diphosphatase UppP [Candidatus Limnocylindrales bacterium]